MTAGRLDEIKWNEDGLVPAIVQDAVSKDVLMLAWMNRESLSLTLERGETHFWSRSRRELWHKGATSGHVQKVTSLAYDCDADTLLVKVIPHGPACHTGNYTCFFNGLDEVSPGGESTIGEQPSQATHRQAGSAVESAVEGNGFARHAGTTPADRFAILGKLESVIAQRDMERPEGAYTTYLFEKGVDKILKKVGEETAEVIIAAKNKDNDELRYEASDLIFHLMVLLRDANLPIDDVMRELESRHLKKPKG